MNCFIIIKEHLFFSFSHLIIVLIFFFFFCLAESLHGRLSLGFSSTGIWTSVTLEIWAAKIKFAYSTSDASRPHLSNAIEASSPVYSLLIKDENLLPSSNMVFLISSLSDQLSTSEKSSRKLPSQSKEQLSICCRSWGDASRVKNVKSVFRI